MKIKLDYLQDISVIRDCTKGSDAVTLLCTNGDDIFFRKFASGEAGIKLKKQLEWIEAQSSDIPSPRILSKYGDDDSFGYDMEYSLNSMGLPEYVHSVSIDEAWNMLDNALTKLEESVYTKDVRNADFSSVFKYVKDKVKKNAQTIESASVLADLMQHDTLIINGKEYRNFSSLKTMLDTEFLVEVFMSDPCSVIHGDLTMENIICTRDDVGTVGFYYIDPNPNNIHETKFIDYSKVMQSIHGNYENLKNATYVSVTGNEISFEVASSPVYEELLKRLRDKLSGNYDYAANRSICFHEVVNWLRLMPYKIHNKENVFVYYAGMIMVMNEAYDMYCGE